MIKRIINLLSHLFNKNKSVEEKTIEQEIIEIKEDIIIPKEESKYQKLYDKIQVGDVYFAKMPLPKKELKRIPKTHQQRPYVIVKKENNKLYAYKCTGTKLNWLKNYEYYPFKQSAYDTSKDSYILLNEIYELPVENIINYYTTLYPKTIKELERRIGISNRNGNSLPRFNVQYNIEVGDIFVLDKQFYYVYQKDSTYIYTHKVYGKQSKDNLKLICIKIDDKDYFISHRKQQQFSSKDRYIIIKMLNYEQQEYIKTKKQQLKKHFKHKTIPQNYQLKYKPGQILNNEYIYLYHINERSYGLYLKEKDDKVPRLIRIKEDTFTLTGSLSLNATRDIVYKLIKYNTDPHHMLNHYFKQLATT